MRHLPKEKTMRRLMVALVVLALALGPGSTLAADEESPAATLGPEQLQQLAAKEELALTLRGQGDLPGARDLFEQVLEARIRTLGPEHPETLLAEDNLVMTLAALDETIDEGALISVQAWTEHRKMWLEKLGEVAAKAGKAKTLPKLRRGLGNIQKQFKAETTWLRKNADRFAPESCLETDRNDWAKRVKQAQDSVDKLVSSINRGNRKAAGRNLDRFFVAADRIFQVYYEGSC
jgi:hypothetical protein